MNIWVYTLTRDRLEYTERAFASLRRHAGSVPYKHLVVDNGSTDGTFEWLRDEYQPTALISSPRNVGISRGSNAALEWILHRRLPWSMDPALKDLVVLEANPRPPEAGAPGVDLIIKFDNDCEVLSPRMLSSLVELYQAAGEAGFGPRYVVSPRVSGIHRQPARAAQVGLAGFTIGLTAIVGGLFHVVPADVYRSYRYPVDLPLAKGQDDHFCSWVKRCGAVVGYVEDLHVAHMDGTDGQAAKYPEYFKRKWEEELPSS